VIKTKNYQRAIRLPSGKLTVCYGKPPFLIGKPSINGPFSIAMLVCWRVYDDGDMAEIGQFSDMEHVIPYLAISHIAK